MDLLKLKSGLLIAALGAFSFAGCGDDVDDPDGTTKPVVVTFSASPSAVASGAKATLTYEVKDATSVGITSSTGDAPLASGANLSGTVETHAIGRGTINPVNKK